MYINVRDISDRIFEPLTSSVLLCRSWYSASSENARLPICVSVWLKGNRNKSQQCSLAAKAKGSHYNLLNWSRLKHHSLNC